jgi:hypothetical protein
MRVLAIAIGLVLIATTSTLGQQPTNEQKTQQLRSGNRRIVIGLAMIAIGALVAPLTALNSDEPEGATMAASVGTMMVGSGVVWWGATERRRAIQPQTTIGFLHGRKVGLQFRRSW